MTHDVKLSLVRVGVVLGALVALVALTTAAVNVLDDRFVRRTEYQSGLSTIRAELSDLKADMRVVRCAVAKDCR